MNAVTPTYQNGYSANAVRTPRDNEYNAFARITRMLRTAETTADRVAAVHKNNELWTIIAADLAQPENALPAQMKSDIASLAIFSIRQGMAVMRNQAQVDPLIDINQSMMKGLRAEVEG